MLNIELDLRHHCIETAINRLQSRLLSKYFKSRGNDSQAEEKLALLEKAQTCFDFSSLRTHHKELAGNSEAIIILTDTGEKLPGITINGRRIRL